MTDIENEIEKLIKNGWLPEKYELSDDIETILKKYDNDDYKGTPAKKDIFNAFKIGDNGEIIKPEDVRILIIGQDPYPSNGKNEGRAHGFAFSFGKKAKNKQAEDSLLNIFEAINKYNGKNNFKEWNTNLEKWARTNKVLLLNTALTHENPNENIIKKHKDAWKCFFNNIVSTVLTCNNKKFVVFLWGRKAEKAYHDAVKNLKEINKDLLVLTTSHPSPQGVKFGFKDEAPNHFKVCDEFLEDNVWLNFPENNSNESKTNSEEQAGN